MQRAIDSQSVVDRTAIARFLAPRSIAMVGASDRSRWSSAATDNLAQGGFSGAVYLVNPRGGLVHGRQAATSCRAIDAPIDLAVVLVPGDAIEASMADLVEARIPAAVVLTSGFAETGAAGRVAQETLARIASTHGIRVLGPNCLGYINFAEHVWLWTTPVRPPSVTSGVAIISQSGATAYFLAELGISKKSA